MTMVDVLYSSVPSILYVGPSIGPRRDPSIVEEAKSGFESEIELEDRRASSPALVSEALRPRR